MREGSSDESLFRPRLILYFWTFLCKDESCYINIEHNWRKTKINIFKHTRTFIFYWHDIHTIEIKKKEYTDMFQQGEMNTYCSKKKQYVEGGQKLQRAYLTRVVKIAMWFSGRVRNKVSAVQRIEKKRSRIDFWSCHVILYEALNRHTHFSLGDNYLLLTLW